MLTAIFFQAVAPFSQDGSIQWSSSDDEALYRLDHEGLPEFESFGEFHKINRCNSL